MIINKYFYLVNLLKIKRFINYKIFKNFIISININNM